MKVEGEKRSIRETIGVGALAIWLVVNHYLTWKQYSMVSDIASLLFGVGIIYVFAFFLGFIRKISKGVGFGVVYLVTVFTLAVYLSIIIPFSIGTFFDFALPLEYCVAELDFISVGFTVWGYLSLFLRIDYLILGGDYADALNYLGGCACFVDVVMSWMLKG